MSRKKARTAQMQLLYQMQLNDDFSNECLENFLDNYEFKGDEIDYINRTTKILSSNLDSIDDLIKKNLKKWSFQRLANVDKAILRLAVCEILYIDEIPKEVSINEAIDIAKQYGSEESAKFINGILGTIYRYLENND